jgi:hypothetical protein
MKETERGLANVGIPYRDNHEGLPSETRFPDGASFRIEIPSVEGPNPLKAVVKEAARRKIPIHRVSQGSGIMLQSRDEMKEMFHIGADCGIEVNLFVGPRASYDTGGLVKSPLGHFAGWQVRGADQLSFAMEDVRYACELGLRSVLVADMGQISVIRDFKKQGLLPDNLVVKSSATLCPSNPATIRLLDEIGANTINVAGDLSPAQLGALRQVTEKPMDIYIEAPDGLGGFIRYYEAASIVEQCAPVYLKLGLRNAADVYPSGMHLDQTASVNCVEKVRRAQILLEHLDRMAPQLQTSEPGAIGLGIPQP